MAESMHSQGERVHFERFFSCTKWDFLFSRLGDGIMLLVAMELFMLRLHCDFVRRLQWKCVKMCSEPFTLCIPLAACASTCGRHEASRPYLRSLSATFFQRRFDLRYDQSSVTGPSQSTEYLPVLHSRIGNRQGTTFGVTSSEKAVWNRHATLVQSRCCGLAS